MLKKLLQLAMIGAALFLFGWLYARRIYHRPFQRRTWASVVIGDSVTDAGMAVMLRITTGSWWHSWVPIACHVLTGGPMIWWQERKLTDEINYIVNHR